MIVYAGKRFTASLVLSRPVDVTCAKCSCAYRYQLVRRGTGSSSAPYYLGQKGAQDRAKAAAFRAATHKLKLGVEPVCCPDCGWLQDDMVAELRHRTARPLIHLAWILPVVFAIATWIVFNIELPRYYSKFSDLETGQALTLLILASAVVLSPIAAIGLRMFLQKRVDPNHAYPARPDPIPGAPPAVRKSADGTAELDADVLPVESAGESTLGYERREPDVLPGGWVTVQLLTLVFPRMCVMCMNPTDRTGVMPYTGRAFSKMRIPICTACEREIKTGRIWWCLAGALLGALPGIALYFVVDHNAQDGYVVLACVFGFLGGIIGWIVRSRLGAPLRFRGFSADRNTVQMRFRNSAYTDGFLAANRAMATNVVARSLVPARPK